MALLEEFESQGNILFKYRSYIPLILLFLTFVVFVFDFQNDNTLFDKVFNSSYVYISFGVSILGLIVRIYTVGHTPEGTSGRNIDNQEAYELNSTGIYSTVRHPLYLGNFLMWLGLCMLTFNFWCVFTFILVYYLYYERIMFAEEQFLRGKFKDAYVNWSNERPAFIPSFKKWAKNKYPFSIKKVLKKEKNGLSALFICFYIFELLGLYLTNQNLEFKLTLWSIGTIVSIILYFILRYFKNNTKLLDEEGR